jgi:hypothetical protein
MLSPVGGESLLVKSKVVLAEIDNRFWPKDKGFVAKSKHCFWVFAQIEKNS